MRRAERGRRRDTCSAAGGRRARRPTGGASPAPAEGRGEGREVGRGLVRVGGQAYRPAEEKMNA